MVAEDPLLQAAARPPVDDEPTTEAPTAPPAFQALIAKSA